MSELLDLVLQAHGGLDRWKEFHKITATIVGGGGLWPLKGVNLDPSPREMTVMLHEEWASVSPFGQPDWHSVSGPTGSRLKPLKAPSSKNARIPEPPSLASRSRKSRRGKKVTSFGAACACVFQTKSRATAKSRTSTSATISYSAGTTTRLTWRAAFPQPNMSTTLWKWRGSAFQPSAWRTCADQI